MEHFSPDWLALREPADHRARCLQLTERLAGWVQRSRVSRPRVILDLGAGSGSNLRYLAPRLGGHQRWICADQDPSLLDALMQQTCAWADALGLGLSPEGEALRIQGAGLCLLVETRRLDLAQGASALPLGPGILVTASALLDLVSGPWLQDLVEACGRQGSPLLAALNYDGRVELEPREPLDGLVIGLVNGHQGRDKGLGPALGPGAGRSLRRLGRSLGYAVQMEPSDWDLGPEDSGLQGALVDGWALAAREQVSDAPGADAGDLERRLRAIDLWRDARLSHVAAGRSSLRVGHQDLLLLPCGDGHRVGGP